MLNWEVRLGLAAVVAALLLAPASACAQDVAASSPMIVRLEPYLWLPTINTTVNFPVAGGGVATTTVSSSPGDYLPKLNFAAMSAGEVRYDRFSALTDILYLNVGISSARIRTFDSGTTHVPVDRTISSSTSSRIQSTIWTLAGGYTVVEGSWGNVDVIAGFRLLNLSQTTSYVHSATITRPDGSIALGRSGSLSVSSDIWNGIGGVRGRIYIGDVDWLGGSRLYVPFYFDAGAGGSNLTWQVLSGVGLAASRFTVSMGYRYLSWDQGHGAVVPKLSIGGPFIAAAFSL